MVKTSLVEADLIAGWRFLTALFIPPERRTIFRVKGAFWLYYPESEEWRLVIATPLVDEIGPLETYARLHPVLQEVLFEIQPTDLYLQNIAVISPRGHPLVKLSRGAKRTLGDFRYVRLTKATVAGAYIEDAYVYMIPPSMDSRSKRADFLQKQTSQARSNQNR